MSDNLEVAKEPDAYLCLDDSGKPYACKLTVEAGEKYIPLYTSRILASQQAAYDAEIARLKESWDKALDEAGKAVYAANAACAMKDEALKFYTQDDFTHRCDKCGNVESVYIGRTAEAAVSSSPQQAVEWERKQLAEAEQRGAVKALEDVASRIEQKLIKVGTFSSGKHTTSTVLLLLGEVEAEMFRDNAGATSKKAG